MAPQTTLDLPIRGMDCASCAAHIEGAIHKLPGVISVQVLVSAARATVTYHPDQLAPAAIQQAIEVAGYQVVAPRTATTAAASPMETHSLRDSMGWGALSLVAVVVLGAALGEQLGVFERATARIPWWLPAIAILLGGWSVLWEVAKSTWRRQITSHTLMTMGAIAAIIVGQWTTAALIVFFMRFSAWLEHRTTERNRQALTDLLALRPAQAHVLRDGHEQDIRATEVRCGEIVVIRPGERIPVDGIIRGGAAPIDQAPITGESVPVDKQVGDSVFAATVVRAGWLHVEATEVQGDTTFARIVRLVEEAETHKTPTQRFADRFSTYYLPLVLGIGIITYLVTGQLLNAVAVLVVSCACAITIATPVVVLASVGRAARLGLLIKGGIALEQLARVDTVVMDKTGTLTHGMPELTDVVPLVGQTSAALLGMVATVEARSEHPLARAMVAAAATRGLPTDTVDSFSPLPGRGVVGVVQGTAWTVGNRRLLADRGITIQADHEAQAAALEDAGKTAFFVAQNDQLVGLVAVADTLRPAAKDALAALRALGVRKLVLLSGDNERVAAAIARDLGIAYQADLLPEDKVAAVRALQAGGATVLMVGDGINDAPALMVADVGIAMGAGTQVALEAADVALLRNDWAMIPEAIVIGRRAARTIRQNLFFTALYNVVGLSLAAAGMLPPMWAAAAQSLPDVAIMLNAARLLHGNAPAIAHPATPLSGMAHPSNSVRQD